MKRAKVFSYQEIDTISITAFTNPIHQEFMKDVLTNASECEAITRNMPDQLAAFARAVEREQSAALKEEDSPLTEQINEKANARGKALTALKSSFRAMMGMPDETVAADAEALLKLAHKYDAHSNQKVDEQTSVISNFLADIETNYMAQVQHIGSEVLFNCLKALNDEVCDLMIQRDKENSDRVVNAMKEARGEVDEAYRELRKAVNAFAYVQGAEAYADFIKYMNALILRYKRTHLGESVGSPEPGEDDELDGDEDLGPEGDGNEGAGGAGGSGSGGTGSGSNGAGSGSAGSGSGSGSTGSGSTGSGSTGSGGSTDTQTWPVINPNDPTVYTGTLHDGSTYYTVSGTINTPIDIPAPEEGTMWPTNMPSVMPPCDFTAYTMPVDSDVTTLYKLEYKDGDEVLRTDYLPAGDIVFLYAAPDGKHWTNTPRYGKMPAKDWTVYTKED